MNSKENDISHCMLKIDDEESSYGDINSKNKNIYHNIKRRILEIVDEMVLTPHPANETFTIVEHGAADGAISKDIIKDVVGLIRQRLGKEKQVHVIYEDIYQNDFNAIFKTIHGEKENSYQDENVFVTTCGTNFYSQCLPSNTVDLAISFGAIFYLSQRQRLSDHICKFFSKNKEEKERLAKFAARDWHTFLRHRAAELKSGGWGIFSASGEVEATLESPARTSLHDTLKELGNIWRHFWEQNVISEDEFSRCSFLYLRNPRELQEPFLTGSELQKTGLICHELRTETIPCLYFSAWREALENGKDETEKFRRDLLRNTRLYSYNAFYGALNDNRSVSEKRTICDNLFSEMLEWISGKCPEDLDSGYIIHEVYAQKI